MYLILLHLPVFWIPFLAKTVQVESHRQEFYLFKREKIVRLSIKKKMWQLQHSSKLKYHSSYHS